MRVSVRSTPTSRTAAVPAARRSRSPSPEPRPPRRPSNGLVRVESPMVGTFYRAPEPGSPPFVEEGDVVAAGQTLCILEAMKLMNEVKSDLEAVVRQDPRRQRAAGRVRAGAVRPRAAHRPPARRGVADVQARPRSEPRRDRRARDPRAARARRRGGRRLLDRRRGRAARAARGPRGADRAAARGAELPLDARRSSRAATTTGCEAVHPGYGFLSENAEFVRACEDNDLVFIGPPADVMERMGDKARAKAEMRAAGVPLVPGTEGAATLAEARAAADGARLPGAAEGGRGRRRPRHAARRRGRTSSRTRTRAPSAEARGGVLRRHALRREGDHARAPRRDPGDLRRARRRAHCGERECSIQRRHQKLIEESPSPALDAELREAMEAAAERACRAHRLPERRHVRVPRRPRRLVLLHRAERAPAGRASRDRDRDAARPRAQAGRGSRQASGCRSPGARRAPGTRSRSASTPRTRRAASRRRPDARRASGRRSARACASTRSSRTAASIPPYYDSLIAKVIVRDDTRAAAIERAPRALRELEVAGVPTTRDVALDDPRQRRVPERRLLDVVPRGGRGEAAGAGGA